jgi:hypothetical protein
VLTGTVRKTQDRFDIHPSSSWVAFWTEDPAPGEVRVSIEWQSRYGYMPRSKNTTVGTFRNAHQVGLNFKGDLWQEDVTRKLSKHPPRIREVPISSY